MSTPAHIAIIGGGVIGTAIAYHLTRRNARVTLVEEKDLASGSSGACDGLVFMQSKKPGVHLSMAMESLNRFEQLSKELPFDIEFKPVGGMVVIENQAQYQAMEKFVAQQREIGLDVALLDQAQTRIKEPHLNPELVGATHCALDAQVNPIHLTLGFGLGAKQNHARILTHTRVKGFAVKGQRITGVETSKGLIKADIIVNAAGAGAGRVGQMLDLDFPIQPRRGQILVTHAARPILSHCLISAQYIAAKFDPDIAKSTGQGISMEQADNGNLLLGSTREFAGFDTSNTLGGIKTILEQTTKVLPALKNVQIIRSFAGLRPFTPDGLPLLGRVDGFDNFFMAAGHEGDGIALAPVTGDLMADLILNKTPKFCLDPFSPNRFPMPNQKKETCHV